MTAFPSRNGLRTHIGTEAADRANIYGVVLAKNIIGVCDHAL